MTRLTMSHRFSPTSRGEPGDLPGLRVMRSRTFRTVLASTLLAIGVTALSLLLLRQAGAPDGQYGIDFGDYRAAAQRLAVGQSPYASEMLTGPTDAQGVGGSADYATKVTPAVGMERAGLAWLPMALVGAVALAGTTLILLWPSRRPSATALVPGQPS